MCTLIANCTAKLYERYQQALEKYCSDIILPDIRHYRGELLLQCLYRRWSVMHLKHTPTKLPKRERYKIVVKVLNVIFQYLDRFYTQKGRHLPSGDHTKPFFGADRYTVTKAAATAPSSLKDMADAVFKKEVFSLLRAKSL